MATLHLFRGWPGSGKSSTAAKMFPNTVRFENDMFCMRDGKYCWDRDKVKESIAWCMDSTRRALELGFDAVVANTFTKKRYVAAYEKLAKECGADFKVYRCTGNFKNVHGLGPELVGQFKRAMEDWPGEKVLVSEVEKKLNCEW